MSYKPTNYVVRPWNSSVSYKRSDMVIYNNERYYSLADNNLNRVPDAVWTDSLFFSYLRRDNIMTITTNSPFFISQNRGSNVRVAAIDPLPYTGCLIDGGSNYIKYINAGPDNVSGSSFGLFYLNGSYWTTGFSWIPSYTTDMEGQMNVLAGKVSESFEQRRRYGINSNKAVCNLVFDNITDREAAAIKTYIEDKGGVEPIKVNLGDGYIGSNVNAIYTLDEPSISTKGYNVNTLTVKAEQVFDIL